MAAQAGAGEVLVSSTVHDAVEGAGFGFEDRGAHALKSMRGEWRLYAVTSLPAGVEGPGASQWLPRLAAGTAVLLGAAALVLFFVAVWVALSLYTVKG